MEKNNMVGMLIIVAIGLIVGLVILQASANNVAVSTSTQTHTNETFAIVSNGVPVQMSGQEVVGTPIVFNSSGAVVSSSNYTIDSAVTSGIKRLYITTATKSNLNGTSVNVTYTFGDVGYISSSGGQAIANLVIVFFAIALVVVALYPSVKERFGL